MNEIQELAGPLHVVAGLSESDRAAVRQQAEALFVSQRWARCLAALEILDHLGDVGPFDALMRARCHRSLGQHHDAARWAAAAQAILSDLDARLGAGATS